MTLDAGTPIGKYVIKRKLAEGGMAEIYLATATGSEGFEKEVVIKRVRSFLSGDEGFVQMFIDEARLASNLNHANVVQIFDFQQHEDSFYLAMEYVRGCSLWDLRKRCREKGIGMPPVLVAHIGAQVAAGLHYAHRAKTREGEPLGLVHRDVTPHNVLLSFDGAVKLTDFGIAKAANKLTQPGVLKGKFAYMSPEQARGETVDARTDVFALGIVLWEMLTGGRLFDGDSEMAVLRAVQQSTIAPPARLNPDVPEDLDEVVCIALERDQEARYQSAGELERALAQCVLNRATSVDDTDVGTFVRRLLDVPLTQFIPTPAALQDRSRSRSGSTPVAGTASRTRSRTGEAPAVVASEPPAQTPASTQAPAPVRESTAVLPGTTPSPARGEPVRTDPAEESLVSASTLVLSRDKAGAEEKKAAPSEPLPARSTLPLPSTPLSSRDSRPMPTVSPAEQGSGPKPETSSATPVPTEVPARVAQVMPGVTTEPAPAEAKRGGKGLWVGVGAAALVLIGGAAALVMPSKQPPAPAPVTEPAPTAPAREQLPSKAAENTVVAAPPAAEPTTPATPPPAETAPAPVAAAKGTLTIKAVPYADVYLDGKLIKSELQRPMDIPLAPGTYKLTFKHPKRTQSFDVTIEANGRVQKSFVVPMR